MYSYRKEVLLEVYDGNILRVTTIGWVVLWRVWEEGSLAIDLSQAEINWLKEQKIDIVR